MTDNSELQRLIRLSRLGRQIAAHLPADLDRELHEYLREFSARAPSKPTSSKALLRAPEPDYGAEPDLVDDDELDKDTVTGR